VGQVLHGSATTTHAVRAAIQRSKASIQALSERYGINPKTVAKWRTRTSPEDRPLGPKVPHSTVLSAAPGVSNLSGEVHPQRSRRGLDRGGQAVSVRGHRSRQQVRLLRNCTIARPDGSLRTSSAGCLNTSRSGSTPCSPTTAFSSRNPLERGVLARFGRCSRPVSAFGRTALTSLAPSTVSTIASRFNHPWTNGQVERMIKCRFRLGCFSIGWSADLEVRSHQLCLLSRLVGGAEQVFPKRIPRTSGQIHRIRCHDTSLREAPWRPYYVQEENASSCLFQSPSSVSQGTQYSMNRFASPARSPSRNTRS
jgi:hypothetical protein